jgi:hypothetical protein
MVKARTTARVTLNRRRVQKLVWTYSGGNWGSPARRVKGALLLMELDDTAGGTRVSPVRNYTGGMDLGGQMGGAGVSLASPEAAGGILDKAAHRHGQVGGRLAVSDRNDPNDPFGEFVYLRDDHGTAEIGGSPSLPTLFPVLTRESGAW